MKRNVLILSFVFMISGCDFTLMNFLDFISGVDRNVVVIVDSPTTLPKGSTQFELNEPAIVMGKTASVCLSLKGGVQSETIKRNSLSAFLGDAEISVDGTSKDGKHLHFSQPMQSWALAGVVESDGELSACMHAKCGEDIPKGTEFVKFDIKSTHDVSVRGIYWQSTNLGDNHH